MNQQTEISIYTDGSCHTQLKTGSWAAIILIENSKLILSGIEKETTHNRMEIFAVIQAISYLILQFKFTPKTTLYSDSQYVCNIQLRKEKLIKNNFISKNGKPLRNLDLISQLLEKVKLLPISIIKIKGHQKENSFSHYNREADKICKHLLKNII